MHQLSPVFVHDTEGKWKTCSNLFKFFLGNVSILVMIIVLEDRLWKKVFLWWLPREKSILAKWLKGWNTWKKPLLSPECQEQGNLLLKLLQRLSRSCPRSSQAPASGGWLGAFNSISTSIAPPPQLTVPIVHHPEGCSPLHSALHCTAQTAV